MVTLDVTTDTYLEEVLDLVCRKRQLDKALHVLKLPGSGAVVLLDREVSSIGNVSDLELYRKRFAAETPSMMTGSPSSASPKLFPYSESHGARKFKKVPIMGTHPLAKEAMKQEELSGGNYKKYTVLRKQTMKIMGYNERILAINGEYIHIMPSSGGKAMLDGGGKTTTVHFSNVIGCEVSRRHPTHFKVRRSRGEELQPHRPKTDACPPSGYTACCVQGNGEQTLRFRGQERRRGGRNRLRAQEGDLAISRCLEGGPRAQAPPRTRAEKAEAADDEHLTAFVRLSLHHGVQNLDTGGRSVSIRPLCK